MKTPSTRSGEVLSELECLLEPHLWITGGLVVLRTEAVLRFELRPPKQETSG